MTVALATGAPASVVATPLQPVDARALGQTKREMTSSRASETSRAARVVKKKSVSHPWSDGLILRDCVGLEKRKSA
jgi:hypothetical protein